MAICKVCARPADAAIGREGVNQDMRDVLKNTPDIHITIEDMIAEGDRVATRFTVRGTNASTGKPMHILVMVISRFVGSKIAEEWELGVPAEP